MFEEVKLKLITPVFIGSGDELIEPFEVLIEKTERKIYYGYEEQLKNLPLSKIKDILKFSKYSDNDDRKRQVRGIVKNHLDLNKIKSYPTHFFSSSDDKGSAKEIKKHVSSLNKLYIPGSTLKGLINTSFDLSSNNKTSIDPLTIRDSTLSDKRIFCEGKNLKINESKRNINAPPLGVYEMLDKNQELKIKIKFDRWRASNFNPYNITSVEEILEKVDRYTKVALEKEIEFLSNASLNKEEANEIKELLEEFKEMDGYHIVLGAETQKFYKIFKRNIIQHSLKSKKSIDIFVDDKGLFKPGLIIASL